MGAVEVCWPEGCALSQDFGNNYAGDTKVKIPWVRRDLSGARVLVMEWIDGMRCTNIRGIQTSGIDVNEFIRCGVVSGLRQLLEVSSLHHLSQLPMCCLISLHGSVLQKLTTRPCWRLDDG